MLRDCLSAALAGQGGLVLIGGEAGIGKTALAEALCREATEQGALVLVGRCYDLTETPPYGPWVELFGATARTTTLPAAARRLRRSAARSARSRARRRSSSRCATSSTALAARRPLVLLLDDLHWADPASLDLLRFLARCLADLPAAPPRHLPRRRTDPPPSALPTPPAARARGAARRASTCAPSTMPPCARSSTRATPSPSGQRRDWWRTCSARGGQRPLHRRTAARARRGGRAAAGRRRLGARRPGARARCRRCLRQVIDGRLARLDEETPAAARGGGGHRPEVPLALWAAVGEADEEALLDGRRARHGGHLLAEMPDGAGVGSPTR